MTSGSCRHVQILDYFDDADLTEDKSSTCCDNCSKRVAPADWQQQCLLIVQALDQQSVTATQLANILSGARKEDGKLSQFSGKMKAFKMDTIRNLIEELIGCGLLEMTVKVTQIVQKVNIVSVLLSLTDQGTKFLQDPSPVQLKWSCGDKT